MNPAPFIIVGGGWRSQFFLRVARALPDRFRCAGMLVRDRAKAEKIEAEFAVQTFRTLDEMPSDCKPLFAVVSVPRTAVVDVLEELAHRKIPALTETPPGADIAALDRVNALTAKGGRIQVAEQFIFQPMHAARLAIIRAGLLGTVSQAQVSFLQGYHGISLMRHYLGVRYESAKITARRIETPIFKGPDRQGPPREEKIISCAQTIAWFDFGQASGSKLGVFDYAQDQHRSYIRTNRILVRGERGEICDARVKYLLDYKTPMEFVIERSDAGIDANLEGYHHKGMRGDGKWWHQNAFIPARLADDELAVATCMDKMISYAGGGDDFYSLAEGSYDQLLSLMMEQSAASGGAVRVDPPAWAK